MRNKRYIWLPAILFAYFVFMTVKFGLPMLRQGHTWRFVIICAAEILVLVLLSISLKKRIVYQQERLRGSDPGKKKKG